MNERIFSTLLLVTTAARVLAASVDDMVFVPSGTYTPLYLEKNKTGSFEKQPVFVDSFLLDRTPVTNRQFLGFIERYPEWGKTQVKRIFTDARYLQHWNEQPTADEMDSPVVNVSWFAASAYCDAQGKSLPTTDQWEYILADNGRSNEETQRQILDWYAVPTGKLPKVGQQLANGFGIYDLSGLIWEWTSDFNSLVTASDPRDSARGSSFCGGGGLNTSNPRDYAAFMRYTYRTSLQGAFTGKNLGFRCAKDVN